MDILALPNVFLRDLMRRMKIKDRLRLRLTCRDFEKLVAETHAGYFDKGSLFSFFNSRGTHHGFNRKPEILVMHLGDTQFMRVAVGRGLVAAAKSPF
ncbi:hypothetical protein PENTCL1PPCAC_20470 [Pristionchus entomophagus]|uniref:F-box domain-containing protein n=1 Tax=Pristionchus entomophagus TaxID=358040 RepID=A0AAV5TVL5_9BILA|nr:hypothetical protein PENTCL1PPCAC_20470 [Pristionchus entomophagus]